MGTTLDVDEPLKYAGLTGLDLTEYLVLSFEISIWTKMGKRYKTLND